MQTYVLQFPSRNETFVSGSNVSGKRSLPRTNVTAWPRAAAVRKGKGVVEQSKEETWVDGPAAMVANTDREAPPAQQPSQPVSLQPQTTTSVVEQNPPIDESAIPPPPPYPAHLLGLPLNNFAATVPVSMPIQQVPPEPTHMAVQTTPAAQEKVSFIFWWNLSHFFYFSTVLLHRK